MPDRAEPTLYVLRVFVDPQGAHGNELGVFVEGGLVSPALRQRVAAQLGYSETVFIDDVARGVLRIFTPTVELPLAGHPLVGTGWLLKRLGRPAPVLRPPAGPVAVRDDEDGRTFITADPASAPPWQLHELGDAAAVTALTADPTGSGYGCPWAWEDRDAGTVRLRVFGAAVGVEEDPATGSAALVLAAQLRRPITIVQGTGSVISASPQPDGNVEVGGHVVLDQQRSVVVADD